MSHSLSPDVLLRVLQMPDVFFQLSPPVRDDLLRYAGRANVTASLAVRIPPGPLPDDVRDRFEAATLMADEHARRLRWEVSQLQWVLQRLAVPVVALKGAAYLFEGLASAQGRLVSDLDLLVAAEHLPRVEQAMRAAGYQSQDQDSYDQHYYREWMHEIPPLVHQARDTTVDLHHNIAPPVSRLKIDAAELLRVAVPLRDGHGLLRLCDEDMVLHLCVHMFHDGELNNSLRELLDLDSMLQRFGADGAFWDRLLDRAAMLGVSRPLYYGISCSRELLRTPVPNTVWTRLRGVAPMALVRQCLEYGMRTAIMPERRARPGLWRALITQVLFLRAHWLRMPPGLLLRHLFTQVQRRGGFKTKQAAS